MIASSSSVEGRRRYTSPSSSLASNERIEKSSSLRQSPSLRKRKPHQPKKFSADGEVALRKSVVPFVQGTRNIYLSSVRIISNQAMFQTEKSFVRTHLLRCIEPLFGNTEDCQLRIPIPYCTRRRAVVSRSEIGHCSHLDPLPLLLRCADLARPELDSRELFRPVGRSLLPALLDDLRCRDTLFGVRELPELLLPFGILSDHRPMTYCQRVLRIEFAHYTHHSSTYVSTSSAISRSRSSQMPSSSSIMILRSFSIPPSNCSIHRAVRISLSAMRMYSIR